MSAILSKGELIQLGSGALDKLVSGIKENFPINGVPDMVAVAVNDAILCRRKYWEAMIVLKEQLRSADKKLGATCSAQAWKETFDEGLW